MFTYYTCNFFLSNSILHHSRDLTLNPADTQVYNGTPYPFGLDPVSLIHVSITLTIKVKGANWLSGKTKLTEYQGKRGQMTIGAKLDQQTISENEASWLSW